MCVVFFIVHSALSHCACNTVSLFNETIYFTIYLFYFIFLIFIVFLSRALSLDVPLCDERARYVLQQCEGAHVCIGMSLYGFVLRKNRRKGEESEREQKTENEIEKTKEIYRYL